MRFTGLGAALAMVTAAVAAGGCSGGDGGNGDLGPPHLDMDTIGDLAVGRQWLVQVRILCSHPEVGEVNCIDTELASIEAITVSDPAVATAIDPSVSDGTGEFQLQVAAEGLATVTVRGLDTHGREHTVDGSFVAQVPDRVELSLYCDAWTTSAPPWPVAVDQLFDVQVAMYAGSTYLFGSGPFPIEAGPFEILGFGEGFRLRAPATPILGTITTPLDPAARLDVQVYDAPLVDGLVVRTEDSAPEPIVLEGLATRVDLVADYTIGGVEPCVSDIFYQPTVSVYIGSQLLCGLNETGGQGIYEQSGIDPRFSVYADFEGTCTGVVSLDGTSGSAPFHVEFASPVPKRTGSWAWENPLPQGEDLTAVGGSGDGDIWAVGVHGAIIHWDGGDWSVVDSPTDGILTDVWASGPSDAWAVSGSGGLLHWDGDAWSVAATDLAPSLQGVWGRAANDVWVVGGGPLVADPGLAFHWDGSQWTAVATGAPTLLMSVWGAGDEIWAVGLGSIVHFDGTAWSTVAPPAGAVDLLGLAGTDINDVWMVGNYQVLHWNGAALSQMPSPPSAPWSVTASPGEVWVAGDGNAHRWTGSAWTATPTGARGPSLGMWHAPGGDTWGVGRAGNIVRETGDAWTRVTTGIDGAQRPINAVWAFADDNVWAVGEEYTTTGPTTGLILHRDATGWSIQSTTTYALHALFGRGPSDLWAVGAYGTVMHWDGFAWSDLSIGTIETLTGVWATVADDVWITGLLGNVLHWTGGTSFEVHIPETIVGTSNPPYNAVWGPDDGDIWVVGRPNWYETVVTHWDGFVWSERDPPTDTYYEMHGVWGTATNDVWVTGDSPFLHHWDGAWQNTFTGLGGGRVWGTSPSNVWVADTMLHWDGMTLTREPPSTGQIVSIHGADATNVWGVGGWGGIHRKVP